MNYSELIDSYIRNSEMSLAEIAEKMRSEKGVKVDRTYISKLRKNPKYAASEEINRAFAEVTGGDVNKLVWAGLVYGSHPSVRDMLMLIGDEVIEIAMKINNKIPGYFNLSDDEQIKYENDIDVINFWESLSNSLESQINKKTNYNTTLNKSIASTKNNYINENNDNTYLINSLIKVPILGSVQAGQPIEMIEHYDGHTLVDPNILHGMPGFALKVQGDSMIGDRIQEGDIVIVAKQEEVHPHEIAVVAVNGDHATLKRVKRYGDMCMLIPSNPSMEPQLVPAEEVHILGKVVEVKFWPK
ncbi:LexA family protein [Cytobacillus kochii]|uniref:LexA family protein n=1 Tax=Cytobacillus kochii TaxID=859143 RepID=UPI00402AA18B